MGVLKGKYARCPLKKRPLSLDYEETAEGSLDEQTEPEDLSIRCGNEAPATPLPQPPHTRPHSTATPNTPEQDAAKHYLQMHGANTRGGCPDSGAGGARTEAASHPGRPLPQDTRQEGRPQAHTSARRPSPPPYTPASPGSHVVARVASPGLSTESSHVLAMQALTTRLDARPVDRGPNNAAVSTSNNHVDTLRPGEYHLHCDPRDNKVKSPHLSPGPGLTSRGPLLSRWDNSGMLEGRFSPVIGPTGHLGLHAQRLSDTAKAAPAPDHIAAPLASSHPHRPWLTDDPPRHNVRSFPSAASIPPSERQQHLMTAANLWNGVVPLSWPLPHMLPPNPPPLPGRQARECGSPGSESASSEGSSGGGRGDSRYTCTDCGKSYSTYSGLSKHKQFHCAALGAKSFSCKHCEKVYTSLGALKMHIRTHTLPCKCQMCGKAFSRPWLLQGHIRTHTGEKPFQCTQCDRCFADRSNLRAHLQTHADVKKYACGTCHKTFSRMSLLNKHAEAACPAVHRPGHH